MAEHIKKRKDKTTTPEYRDNYDRTFKKPLPKDIREPAHYMDKKPKKTTD